jgi:coenzyme F420-0:L-glutamate ligase/coenzyme F420-1:gamma-L-glutamate ligase
MNPGPSSCAPALIAGRRSIRRFLDRPVPEPLLDEVLRAAAAAPSAHNRQPWRFGVITDAAIKARLAAAMGERLRRDRTRDGDPAEAIDRDVRRSHARITAAPVAVLVCLTMAEMDRYPDARRAEAERLMAVQGTAMATQNLLLAAHALGLGASVMCAPLFCPEVVREALALAEDLEPQALVTLGYPADDGKPFTRRPLSEVVFVPGGRA